jgi:predicted AAA+ superfamily ATPase
MIQTEKFYLFDVGVANFLARRKPLIGSSEFGKSLEHFILMEILAYKAYRNPELEVRFWRSASNQEIDFIVGDKELALEIKGKKKVIGKDLKIMREIIKDGPIKHRVIVSLEEFPRKTEDGILCLPWKDFLIKLWNNEFELR